MPLRSVLSSCNALYASMVRSPSKVPSSSERARSSIHSNQSTGASHQRNHLSNGEGIEKMSRKGLYSEASWHRTDVREKHTNLVVPSPILIGEQRHNDNHRCAHGGGAGLVGGNEDA